VTKNTDKPTMKLAIWEHCKWGMSITSKPQSECRMEWNKNANVKTSVLLLQQNWTTQNAKITFLPNKQNEVILEKICYKTIFFIIIRFILCHTHQSKERRCSYKWLVMKSMNFLPMWTERWKSIVRIMISKIHINEIT